VNKRIREYVAAYRDYIVSHADRDHWSDDEWYDWFSELVISPGDYNLTRKDIFNLLGVIKGSLLMSAIRASYPDLADQLKVSEGGININHPDFSLIADGMVSSDVVTQDDVNLISTLTKNEHPRWKTLGLPELKLGHIQSALKE